MEARQKQEWALRKYDRETMLIQASIQLQNMMQSAEYNRILNNHPLISSSVPTLSIYKKLDPNKPVPLLVIISPPAVEFEKVPHAGQGLAKIETTLTDRLREFLQDNNNYPVKSSIRPTKFLGGVWDSKRLHSEGAMENLYYTHQSIPTLILESKVDGDFINVYVTNWDSMDTHYDYKKIISIPWKDVLYPLAKENARLWKETRNQLLDQGRTPKEISEEGGDDEENLKILEAEARELIESYLAELRLKIHPVKSQLFATRIGANFLGFRILPDRIRVRTENLKSARRRMRQMQKDYAQGRIKWSEISQSRQSWVAHLEHGDTWHLQQSIFANIPLSESGYPGFKDLHDVDYIS